MNLVHDSNQLDDTQIRQSRIDIANTEPLLMTSEIRSSRTVPVKEIYSSDEEQKEGILPLELEEYKSNPKKPWKLIKSKLFGPEV